MAVIWYGGKVVGAYEKIEFDRYKLILNEFDVVVPFESKWKDKESMKKFLDWMFGAGLWTT